MTSTISLPEVNTVAEANALVVKIYMWSPSGVKTNVDQGRLTLNYYLD